MSKRNLHISQITFVPSLIKNLKNKGVNVDRFIQNSKLNRFNLEDHNAYVPNLLLFDFLERVQHSQGLYSITGQFYNDFKLSNAGDFGSQIFGMENLHDALTNTVKFQKMVRTNHLLSYEVKGNKAYFYFNFYDLKDKQLSIQEDIGFAQTIDAFRCANGENWEPLELHTTAASFKRMEKVLPKGNYKVYCKQPVNMMVVKTSDVLSPIINPYQSFNDGPLIPETFSNKVNFLLKNSAPGKMTTLEEISDYSNMTTRTLKRKLATEGTNFNEISNKILLTKATDLLTNTFMSVNEIAQHLGYTKATNFVRAFKKQTQFTPDAYRALC